MTFPTELLARNALWSASTDDGFHKEMDKGQWPKIFWIGCSDSRLPESVVCDAKPGEIFVHRNVANQFNEEDDSAMSALTYAVEALGVHHVIVVGHTNCGGVAAAHDCMSASTELPSPALTRFLSRLMGLAKSNLSEGGDAKTLLRKNVEMQVDAVVKSKVIQANWEGKKSAFPGQPEKKVHVHGWLHNVGTGKLEDLKITRTPPS